MNGPFGDQPPGSFVNTNGYLLCPACSKGAHRDHIDNKVCQCDLPRLRGRGGCVMPKRIQRKRTKGWRMPEGAVYVGRPTRWGNPYAAGGNRVEAVRLFEDMLTRAPLGDGSWGRQGETVHQTIQRELAGHDLACWCPLEDEQGNRVPCHADVLLELANAEPSP